MKSKILALILIPFSFFGIAFAWPVPDPYSYLNYLQDLKTAINTTEALAKQAEQIRNQVQMIQLETKNTASVSDYQWQNIQGLVQRMDAQSQQGQALSYSAQNVDAQFRQKYPDYVGSSSGQMNYEQSYQQWNASTLDTLPSPFNSNPINSTHFF